MIPGEFDYLVPHTVDEAIAALVKYGDDAKILAGGQSLIPAMRFRLASPATLIDINRLTMLEYIREEDGHLAIGAMTRESEIERSAVIKRSYPLLFEAAHDIADPLVRNRATVGGNLAHADPANDHPAVMLALNAEIVARGSNGDRVIPIDDFFTGMFETSLDHDELLIEIRIPKPPANSGGSYRKLERKVGDYAISAVAVQLTMDGNQCSAARIALTNVSPTPMRSLGAEHIIVGQELTEEVLERAGQAAALECEPSNDLRGSADYKRDLTRVLAKRAIRRAVEHAAGGIE